MSTADASQLEPRAAARLTASGAVVVADDALRTHARRLLESPRVSLRELALSFDESTATSASVRVAGESFFPRILADLEGASSSIHIVEFGFRPGQIGDQFADVLVAKAAAGVAVRLIVDRNGSDPEGGSRRFYERLTAAGVQVCVATGSRLRARPGPLGTSGAPAWRLEGLGHIDHRKLFVVDGRVGWVGGAGIEDHFMDGRFHDLFVRLEGAVVGQLQLVFLAGLRWLGGSVPPSDVTDLLPQSAAPGGTPARVLHNAPGSFRPITDAIAASLDGAVETLDVVNPYVTDRGMIRRIERAARRGVRVRLFVPHTPNNWACGAAQRFHHRRLLDAGVEILEYPTMLHAKAFVRDGQDVLAGTCNLEAWSLKRFFEVNVLVRSRDLAREFDERFTVPAVAVCVPGTAPTGLAERAKSAALAAVSPLL